MDKQSLLNKFNLNTLNDTEAAELENLFVSGEVDISDFEVYERIENDDIFPEISKDSNVNFQEMLSNEMLKNNSTESEKHWFSYLPLSFKFALSTLLLLCAFLLGKTWNTNQNTMITNQYAEEKSELNLMNELLNNPSPSQRITLVNNADNLSIKKDHVVRILFMTLNHDKSANVRMAAVDALMDYASQDFVREGLIKALGQQTSPLMVDYLAEALRIIGEKIPVEKTNTLKEHLISKEFLLYSNSSEIY